MYNLEIRLSQHDLAKLKNYANAVLEDNESNQNETTNVVVSDEFSIANVQDVTEILKNMLVNVETSRLLTISEKLFQAMQNFNFIETGFFRYTFGLMFFAVKQKKQLF